MTVGSGAEQDGGRKVLAQRLLRHHRTSARRVFVPIRDNVVLLPIAVQLTEYSW